MTEEEKEAIIKKSIHIGEIVGKYCNEEEIKVFNLMLEDYKEKNNLIQKQNKVIDEMAELIARKVGTRTEICHNMNCDKSTEKVCKQCAIEYFINKAVEKI